MRAPFGVVVIAAVLGAATACSGRGDVAEGPPVADSASVARARAAAGALGPDLAAMLMAELKRGGPESAVAVCADSAQLLTARHSVDGVQVRRIGTRVRNPLNAPDSLESRLLAYLAAEQGAGRLPAEVTEVTRAGPDGGWELRYLKPIMLQEFCVTCHGARDDLPPAVRGLIAARYPSDQAVGYAAGELRGAISVRVPLPATTAARR
jgi:Protein of unknown function (DUF3365)